MGGGEEASADGVAGEALHAGLEVQVEGGLPGDRAVEGFECLAAGQRRRVAVQGCRAEQQDDIALVAEARAAVLRNVFKQAERADYGRGVDGLRAALVVEAHVAADHGHVEGAAGVCHALDALL